MLEIYEPDRDLVWIDTVSLHSLVRRIRASADYRPATSVLKTIGPGAKESGPWFFLTAAPLPNLPSDLQFELPIITEISVFDDLARALDSLETGTRVGLGISAPKQNYLAIALHAYRPDLEYHCLGAAVARFETAGQEASGRRSLSGSGFEWLAFLLTSPRRTWGKINVTLREGARALVHGPSRAAFKQFAAICSPALEGAIAVRSQGYSEN